MSQHLVVGVGQPGPPAQLPLEKLRQAVLHRHQAAPGPFVQGKLSSRYAAENLPGADIVKAFNQLPANTLAAELDPDVGKRVIFIATDSPEAGDRIAGLERPLF
jgi:predicted dinucleotide-binding enzyme